MSKLTEKDIINILSGFFSNKKNLVDHQIGSFDHFVQFGMQEIVDQEHGITLTIKRGHKYEAKFGQITLAPPQVIEEDRSLVKVTPQNSRLRSLTYSSAIHCDITETITTESTKEVKHHPRVVIGRMPVMLKSSVCTLSKMNEQELINNGECPNDPGGYFIVKGNERVLVSQMRANYNHVCVIEQKPDEKYKYIAETRSMSPETGHSVMVQAMIGDDEKTIVFSLPYISKPIPVGIVFKALGFCDIEEIRSLIGLQMPKNQIYRLNKFMRHIARASRFVKDKEQALKYIGEFTLHSISEEKGGTYAQQVVESELFPHQGISGSIKDQACFLGNMLNKLLATYLGCRECDDKDNLGNKRLDTAGSLLFELFRNLYKKYVDKIKTALEKRKQHPDILTVISRIKDITQGLHSAFSTGNWGVQKNSSYVKAGVSQILDRMTYAATLSHMRRIVLPIGKEGKNTDIRKIQGSQFGYICPAETPEGGNAGAVLNMAMTCHITTKIPMTVVRAVLENSKTITFIDDMKICDIASHSRVFLNGALIGYCKDGEETTEEIKKFRAQKFLSIYVSVSYNIVDNDINIYCDDGRFIRPLFDMEDNKLKITPDKASLSWRKLLKKGYVAMIDSLEVQNAVVAMKQEKFQIQYNDYCEIHPMVVLGVMASIIPFPDHSQSPRNCYQASMGKQALGASMTNHLRTDTKMHILKHSQIPIISTIMSKMIGLQNMPAGENVVVAIGCYTGYNMEDSVLMNLSAVQRELFHIVTYMTITETEKQRETYSHEKICVPPDTNIIKDRSGQLNKKHPKFFKRKNGNYSLLDENGIIMPRFPLKRKCGNKNCKIRWFPGRERTCQGCGKLSYTSRGGGRIRVEKGDVLIGKVVVNGDKTGVERKTDASRVVQAGEEGYIDRVLIFTTPNGYKLVKIVISTDKPPEVGDKLASRAAQKGTIGRILAQEDMPYTEEGIVPDIIINSLCMPSRMTINQLLEGYMNKICALRGDIGDCSPFTERSVNIAEKLVSENKEFLENMGRDPMGWETMYNGFTGEQIKAKIYMCPTYYQRLKHLVGAKIHARARGGVTMLTRQPREGRSRDGGLRFGEMERDCMIAHGAARFLQERLHHVSDKFQIPVCKKCGIITSKMTSCQMCRGDDVVICAFPYASKLLIQELGAMCIKVTLRPKV